MRSPVVPLLAVIVLWVVGCQPARADELQDRIEAAIEAFGGIIPTAPDVGLGWADMVITGAVAKANPSQVVSSDKIGEWLIANPPAGADELLMQRVEWVASTLKTVMQKNTKFPDAYPAQQISVSELKLRIVAALDKVVPGPSRAEQAIEAVRIGKLIEEAERERAARRKLVDTWGEVKTPMGTSVFGNHDVKVTIK